MSDTSSNYSEDAPLPEVTYAVGVETEVPGTHGQLHKTVLVEGDGTKPMNGSKVTVHYVGTLLADGSKFDSSRDRSEPFEFTIGKGQVIKGWDQGVATMRIGEKANLKCAPEYAYGAAGSPPKIPANSTLMFEVELFGWTKSEDVSETKDRSLMKATRVEGKGFDRAEYEAEATIDVATVVAAGPTEDGEVLMEKKDWAVVVGETVLPAGLEAALKSFIEGETAAVDVAGHLVAADDAEWKLAKGQAARYVITVKALKVVKPYTFDKAVKLDEAKKRKDQGNAYFKAQDWARAAAKYRRALEFVEYDTALEDSSSEGATLKVTVFNNLAQVELSQGNYPECIAQCDKCLAVQPKNPKAHFRRGKARAALGDWEEAKEDFNGILAEDPTNGDVQRELAAVQEKLRKHRQKEKAAFGNMFAKMAAMEEREHPTEKSAEPAQEEAQEEAKEEAKEE